MFTKKNILTGLLVVALVWIVVFMVAMFIEYFLFGSTFPVFTFLLCYIVAGAGIEVGASVAVFIIALFCLRSR